MHWDASQLFESGISLLIYCCMRDLSGSIWINA
jgi:hypothetical protein